MVGVGGLILGAVAFALNPPKRKQLRGDTERKPKSKYEPRPEKEEVYFVDPNTGEYITLDQRTAKYTKLRGLASPSMVKTIASEARSPQEYARRVEAWNASEAKPLSITLLAKAYRGASPATTAKLIREAREARLEQRERHWTHMSRGLRGKVR